MVPHLLLDEATATKIANELDIINENEGEDVVRVVEVGKFGNQTHKDLNVNLIQGLAESLIGSETGRLINTIF